MADRSVLVFFVNGKKVVDDCVDPEWTLLYYLRNKLRLCGTKLGCGEGGCGACTVMVSRYDRMKKKINHLAINACLAPLCSVHGAAVTTVEGIGSTKTKLHPVQERIAKSHGSQCGYCTPGIVMSMYTLLRNNPKPTMEEMEVAFQGNLCRCTGYRPIIEGYKSFACGMGESCCQFRQNSKDEQVIACNKGQNCCKLQNEESMVNVKEFTPYDPSQEPIFPPELKNSDQYDTKTLIFRGKEVTWFRPTSLAEVLELKSQHPEAKLVVGNTEIGVEVKFKNMSYPVLIYCGQIPELSNIQLDKEGMTVGASTTLLNFEKALEDAIEALPKEETRNFKAILEMLNLFASNQIRSVGSLGGNIMTGSPISDLIPILMASKARVLLQSKNRGPRSLTLDQNFIIGYRKTVLEPDEVLVNVTIPLTEPNRYSYAYKQSRRRDDDIAIVNFAINVKIEPQNLTIDDVNLVFGGMSFTTIRAVKTETKLKGLQWTSRILDDIYDYLLEDLPLSPEAPGGMVRYRHALCLSLFFKAFLAISSDLGQVLDERELSVVEPFAPKKYQSAQYFDITAENNNKSEVIHRPIVHLSAYKQATGEAVYCDDGPKLENELHLAFVLSTKAHARVKNIDPSEALAMDGVYDFVSAKDIDHDHNRLGLVVRDEKIFYDEVVTSQGQILGGVLASDQITARKAAKKVQVDYEELEPVIVTIQDAIQQGSFFDYDLGRVMEKGDVDEAMAKASNVVEGECKSGGQEQFYLETIAAIVVPKKEDGELEVICTTQNPTQVAIFLSDTLDLDQNKIVVKVRRLGGGFGGKDYKPSLVVLPAAIAALKTNRPVRCSLDRDEDIVMTGGRHPFLSKYKVGFDDEGKILALDVQMYLNGGYALDASPAIMQKAMTHLDNSYHIPAMRVEGYICKTNLPSNTAFRGFGAPQGMFVMENVLEEVADHLHLDRAQVRASNLYQDGDVTHYGQTLQNCTLEKCYRECLQSFGYHQKLKEVEDFNKQHRYKKRGVGVVTTKFGVAYSKLDCNQGGALVLVYTDGSVLLHYGGVEMGQGLHTKMIQVASSVLQVPVDKIHITDVATDKIPNTSPTAASASSDIYGMAIMEACGKINERLRPYKEADPSGTFPDWVRKAYSDRVKLTASGFYVTPNIGHDWSTGVGNLYSYYTYGVACCDVEIDTLTGDHRVGRVDIVMDVGQSLNPAIDVGQIEGAFMQGYGLFVLEEMVSSPQGVIYTKGPGTYKLPGFGDIPEELNVSLLKGVSNPRAIFSSKAIGEPPLFLGSSVYFAVRDAIKAARRESGTYSKFKLDSPATCERIRMACQDDIVRKLKKEPEEGTYTPWGIPL